MGTNAAPELATLYLYSYEASYIDELCITDVPNARSCHLSSRLIDDLLSVDNDNFDAFTTCLKKVVSILKLFLVDKLPFLMIMCNSVA